MKETNYEPGGKAAVLLRAMREDPKRAWTYREAAEAMGCTTKAVTATVKFSTERGLMHRHVWDGRVYLSVDADARLPKKRESVIPPPWVPDPADPRISKVVPGWTPPKMVCVRLGQ